MKWTQDPSTPALQSIVATLMIVSTKRWSSDILLKNNERITDGRGIRSLLYGGNYVDRKAPDALGESRRSCKPVGWGTFPCLSLHWLYS